MSANQLLSSRSSWALIDQLPSGLDELVDRDHSQRTAVGPTAGFPGCCTRKTSKSSVLIRYSASILPQLIIRLCSLFLSFCPTHARHAAHCVVIMIDLPSAGHVLIKGLLGAESRCTHRIMIIVAIFSRIANHNAAQISTKPIIRIRPSQLDNIPLRAQQHHGQQREQYLAWHIAWELCSGCTSSSLAFFSPTQVRVLTTTNVKTHPMSVFARASRTVLHRGREMSTCDLRPRNRLQLSTPRTRSRPSHTLPTYLTGAVVIRSIALVEVYHICTVHDTHRSPVWGTSPSLCCGVPIGQYAYDHAFAFKSSVTHMMAATDISKTNPTVARPVLPTQRTEFFQARVDLAVCTRFCE